MYSPPSTNTREQDSVETREEQLIVQVPEYNPYLKEDVIMQNEKTVINALSTLVGEPTLAAQCDSSLPINQLFSIDVETIIPICGKRYLVNHIERPDNPELSRILTHIACLSRAVQDPGHTLIMDGCMLKRSLESVKVVIESVNTYTGNRWDVICFTQHVERWQPYGSYHRLLRSTSTTGYLVNESYVSRLLIYMIQRVRNALKGNVQLSLTDIFTSLQPVDMWIGFSIPLGTSTGSDTFYRLDSLTKFHSDYAINTLGDVREISVVPAFIMQKILVYTEHMSDSTRKECVQKLFKGHVLEFQDAPVYRPPSTNASYIFYVSSDSRIYSHIPATDLLCDKLIIVRDPLRHTLSHTFHGGPSALYTDFCMSADKESFTTSHSNTVDLGASYMYAEKCLYSGCTEPMCCMSTEPYVG